MAFTESVVEDAALVWLENFGDPSVSPPRDAILSKMLSGEVRVKTVEHSLERTV